MSFEIEVVDESGLDELREKLTAKPTELMQSIAEDLLAAVRAKLAAGAGWARLAPATLQIRLQRGISSTTPLHATGALAASLRARSTASVAAAGVKFPGHLVNTGFTTGPDSAIPSRAVPGRPFVYLTDAEEGAALDRIANFYVPEAGGG